ncbi:MAG: L,D-transpeptidase, partial [Actinomycetota bacterium]|nr:L,D-transpeptidase [Actinomycetota bacterium]
MLVLLGVAGCTTTNATGTTGMSHRVPTPVATAPPTTVAPAAPKSIVATASGSTVKVFTTPGADGPSLTSLSNPNEMGVPLVFLVKAQQPDWLQVMLPMRPNGVEGWIRSSDVTLTQSEWRVRVALADHHLTVWRGNDVVVEAPVAVGTASAPTPTGDYYLTELLDTGNPGGAYGPYAFGLSSYSDVYTEFAGGPGQIGLHGTNAPGALGTDASHGCIRVNNDVITKLAFELPPGSPITVAA